MKKEEIYDDDDLTLGNWVDTCTPEKMKSWTEHKLFFCQVQNAGGQYSRMAESELARRRNSELKQNIQDLTSATEYVHIATLGVQEEVAKLAASSDTLEKLTKRLIKLTDWLIVLTVVAIIAAAVVPIGIKIYEHLWEAPVPQIVPVSQPPAPKP